MNKIVNITFYPDSDNPELIKVSQEYQDIWDQNGTQIVGAIQNVSGLEFLENEINAIVFEGISHSSPLCLRASLAFEIKKGTVIHELCHRLISGNLDAIKLMPGNDVDLVSHQQIFLILYDVWEVLYGRDFAEQLVAFDNQRPQFYKQAWDWVLAKTKAERQAAFNELKIKKGEE